MDQWYGLKTIPKISLVNVGETTSYVRRIRNSQRRTGLLTD